MVLNKLTVDESPAPVDIPTPVTNPIASATIGAPDPSQVTFNPNATTVSSNSPLSYLTGAAYSSEVLREQANATLTAANAKVAADVAAGLNPNTTVTNTSGTQTQVGTTNNSTTSSALTAAQQQNGQNIFDAVQAQMTAWGILIPGDPNSQALLSTLKNLAMTGAGSDTVSLALQNSAEYQARFSGNAARVANGLAALSPADYIATEQAYDQILQSAGVPAGYYSSSADKAKLIGADVSASELQSRVDLAKQSISQADPFYTSSLQNLYGLSSGDMIAHVLDPSAALPLITQQVNSAQIAAEAARAGSGIGLNMAQQLAGQGVTQAQAAQGFQQIATQQPAIQSIASRYNAGLTTEPNIGAALQAATFGTTVNGINQAQATQQLNLLKTAETSAFSGSAGAATGSLGLRDTSGLQ
jgi:hypothetical protein